MEKCQPYFLVFLDDAKNELSSSPIGLVELRPLIMPALQAIAVTIRFFILPR